MSVANVKTQNRSIIDKPHNAYLQIFVNFGFVGFVFFITLIGVYFKRFVSHLKSEDYTTGNHWRLLGVSFGLLSYLTACAAGDFVVAVAPVFWVLFGLGFGLLETRFGYQ